MCSLAWSSYYFNYIWLVYISFKVIQGPTPLDLNTELPYQKHNEKESQKEEKREPLQQNVMGQSLKLVDALQNSEILITVGKAI